MRCLRNFVEWNIALAIELLDVPGLICLKHAHTATVIRHKGGMQIIDRRTCFCHLAGLVDSGLLCTTKLLHADTLEAALDHKGFHWGPPVWWFLINILQRQNRARNKGVPP